MCTPLSRLACLLVLIWSVQPEAILAASPDAAVPHDAQTPPGAAVPHAAAVPPTPPKAAVPHAVAAAVSPDLDQAVDVCVKEIQGATTRDDAATFYARGQGLDRGNVKIQNAYMRKMLTLGAPAIANFAALVLIVAEPTNGLAWAVVGYNYGKANDLDKAYKPTVRAAALVKDDKSLANNLGQETAWYDAQDKPPRLTDAEQLALQQAKVNYVADSAYTAAYSRVSACLKQAKDTRKKLQVIEDKVKTEQETGTKAEAQVADLEQGIAPLQANIHDYRQQMRGTSGSTRNRLSGQIRQEENAIGDIRRKLDTQKKALQEAKTSFAQDTKTRDQLRQQVSGLAADLAKHLQWDPPAVDGVVTPVSGTSGKAAGSAAAVEAAPPSGTSGPAPAPGASGAAPADPTPASPAPADPPTK